ncbi:DUF6004 family protein [Streptomyces wedmorensis]|uniref:DUF6004 family protein n=1 Tax=Streptomyces wedmorensis TaxID=43759 RepID=UPI00341958B5
MSPTNETYESLNLEPKPIRPHLLAAATMVFGEDGETGRRETVTLSGLAQFNTWPLPGFEHHVDEQGRSSFDVELISAPEIGVKGYSHHLEDRVQILTDPSRSSRGRFRQVTPGTNLPAQFGLDRFGILETSILRLTHRDALQTRGVVDGIPPFVAPLSAPYPDSPLGSGPFNGAVANGFLPVTNLPVAWYPADDENQPVGDTPSLFLVPSPVPFMVVMTDPTMIMQVSLEGELELEVDGKSVTVTVSGDHRRAAGAEILLFGPDKHSAGEGVQARLARLAVVGECAELGGKVMLRVSWTRPSEGTLGDGDETSLSRVRYPTTLHVDASVELCTPDATLYADTTVHLAAKLNSLEATGTELLLDGADAALLDAENEAAARLTGLRLKVSEAHIGETAPVSM